MMSDQASNWVIVDRDSALIVTPDHLYGGTLIEPTNSERLLEAIRSGAGPAALIRKSPQHGRSKIARRAIRSIAWVESAGVLIVKQHWLWDPIRLPVPNREVGREMFARLHQELGNGKVVRTRKIGMHDLAIDPRLAIGVFFCLLACIAIISGAVDHLPEQRVPVRGYAVGRIFADLGRELGPGLTFGLGCVALIAGMVLLGMWFKMRPEKMYFSTR